MRCLVAMSGGVDSAAAAVLLQEAGYDVVGVTLRLTEGAGPGRCCGEDGPARAAAIAHALGLSHYVVDAREVFRRAVIADFRDEYARGRTPNPCVRCNKYVKFTWLLERATAWGCQALATGHYVRREADVGGAAPVLRRASYLPKDQSYFLWATPRGALSRLLFPLGSYTKDEAKAILRRRVPTITPLPESQDACFVSGEGRSQGVIRTAPEEEFSGPIVDEKGAVLGYHHGIFRYTVGQRRGLGVAASKKLYVKKIDPETNTVVLAPGEALGARAAAVNAVNWLLSPPRAPLLADVKVRYRDAGGPALLDVAADGRVLVSFVTPRRAVAPGQSAVFYDGDILLGGGVIDEVYE